MLLSWGNEVRIGLTPERVTLARVSRRWRAKVVAKQLVDCAATEPADWRACIKALELAVQEPAWQGAEASVVISNHFVRYALVPWSEHLITDEEKHAWIKHHFVELYGEPGAPAEYRWSEDRPDVRCVASAIEAEFMGRIRAAFEGTSLRLHSVQPYLMAVFNRWKRRIQGAPAWLVLPENGRVCIATVANNQWRKITSRPVARDWESDMSLMLGRELMLSENETPAVVLAYAPDAQSMDLVASSDVPVTLLVPRELPGYSPRADAPYTMALTGAV